MSEPYDVAIIGAGIAGLLAAEELAAAGASAVVLEKSRGVGGRMATRRAADAAFDHGAQFFTVRTHAFRKRVDRWQEGGVAGIWCYGFSGHEPGHPRYRGVPGMTAIAKEVARPLDVRLETRVQRISASRGQAELESENGERFAAGAVILTAPLPQALALIRQSELPIDSATAERLDAVVYDPCLVLLAVDPKLSLPAPGGMQRPTEHLDWIADNGQKGVSGRAGAVTVHAAPELSRRYYEASDEEVISILSDEVRSWGPFDPAFTEVKRWRYSKPQQTLDEGCVAVVQEPPVILAGDAFSGARVEGAATSGLAAADLLQARWGARPDGHGRGRAQG